MPGFGAPKVVAVGAGKGGVGKSTVALGLARALRAHGRTGVLDLDFQGPNIPAMVGVEHQNWTASWTLASRTPDRFKAVTREELAIVSTGFILGEGQPLGVDMATAHLMAKQLIHGVEWPRLDYLVVDLPPGTSTVQQIMVREIDCDGAIVVVTPQLIAHIDARKVVEMFRHLKVSVLGAVENMTATACPHCGQSLTVFAPCPPGRSIWQMQIERLAAIPLILSADLVVSDQTLAGDAFQVLADRVVERLSATT